jgi:adenylate kinase family enzyme
MVVPVRRVVVIGCSGAGKTTLARRLAAALGVPHIELDGIYHQTGWQPLDSDRFRAELSARMAASPDGWVICGNYNAQTGDIHIAQADTLVWVDPPRRVVMWRVFTRTVWRVITRKELWNGNREPLTNLYRWDPEQNIIRWAWVKWPHYRERNTRRLRDGTWSHLDVHRLRSTAEVDAFATWVEAAATNPAQSPPRRASGSVTWARRGRGRGGWRSASARSGR